MQLKETTTTGQGVTTFTAETSKYRLTLESVTTRHSCGISTTKESVTIEDLVSGKSNTVNPPSLEAATDLYNGVKNVIASVGE